MLLSVAPKNGFEDKKLKIRIVAHRDFSLQLWRTIALAHIEALPGTINSIAGEMHLKRLYQVTCDSGFGDTIALTVEDDLAAVLTISSRNHGLPLHLILQSAKGLLTSFPKIPMKEYLSLIVDLIQVNNYYRKQDSNSIKILTLFVLPEYRKKGLARIILNYGLNPGLHSKSTLVLVDVQKDSTTAIKTYSNFGFTRSHETTKSIIMKKSLLEINQIDEEPEESRE
jgi:ribosomal protein S18 acetylase RimI-like enzyme